ncbi:MULTISPECIES: hypothetical protein [Bradyrhizobium]|uniref:hypothetical protein n=1 Tax=Bradyrhizobium TaxID=374 RepID=UPI001BAB481A|nr:hypothetical protein [Bradyrhizobium liaoningense]MBR0988355.1 hypothetical protein [Bradyrhizobium liaoningense]GMP12217.1 hypothetical protein TM239_64820 [Bradyrhizobium sp. TM239]
MSFDSDPIQRTAPPLPRFQTEAGGRDPLPLSSPLEAKKQIEAAHKFESYLESHARRTHEMRTEDHALLFSTLAHLREESVYSFQF